MCFFLKRTFISLMLTYDLVYRTIINMENKVSQPKKKSPRAPSTDLEEALNRIEDLYEDNNLYAVSADAAAESIGYKNARSGAAKAMLATLSYYNLIERSPDSRISVTKDFEQFKFLPDKNEKAMIVLSWLKSPKIYSGLVEKYGKFLPADSALKYEFIEMGFKPNTADDAIKVFKKSVEFAVGHGSFNELPSSKNDIKANEDKEVSFVDVTTEDGSDIEVTKPKHSNDFKSITIFLPDAREAILQLPRPFYMKDREVIKRQIEALLADDEEF